MVIELTCWKCDKVYKVYHSRCSECGHASSETRKDCGCPVQPMIDAVYAYNPEDAPLAQAIERLADYAREER